MTVVSVVRRDSTSPGFQRFKKLRALLQYVRIHRGAQIGRDTLAEPRHHEISRRSEYCDCERQWDEQQETGCVLRRAAAAGSLTSTANPLSTTLLIAAGSASVAAAASSRNSTASAICFLYGLKNGSSAASGRNVRADGALSIGTEAGVTADWRDAF